MAQYNSANNSYQKHNHTLFESVILADQFGNPVPGGNPTGMAVDAFGRARMSQPFTLFDSFHRYQDNGRITTANSATGATVTHNANAGHIECTLDTTSGSFIKRESARVFAYQPGKSLQILETFVMSPAKENLRQRYGYFDVNNGIFLEQVGSEIYFVERSLSSGTVTETKVPKSQWSIDPMDGTGPSNLTLDLSKAQILFIDIEWLGLGSVRCGFVINGQFIHCHTFHHANIITTTYMTTACLPVRAEIENIGTTASSSTLKVICASVISEGGYELRGRPRSVGHVLTSKYSLATPGTLYPLLSIRLKSSRLGAIVIPKNFSIAVTTASNYRFAIVAGGVTSGGSWVSAGDDSSVEYNLSATSLTGGNIFEMGYITATNQASVSPSLEETPFKYQLERNTFTNTAFEFTIAMVSDGNNQSALASINWEEIT